MKLVTFALLSLTAFSNPVQATSRADRVQHFPRQDGGFNATSTTPTSSSPSSAAFTSSLWSNQVETSSSRLVVTSSVPAVTPGQKSQISDSELTGETLSTTQESGTGLTALTTSDEIRSQILNISDSSTLTNGAVRDTDVVSTSQTRFSTSSSRSVGGMTTTVRSNISTSAFTSTVPVSSTLLSIRSSSRIGNASTMPSPSGGSSGSDSVKGEEQGTLSEKDEPCVSTTEGAIPTTWTIIYTSTTTFYGDPTDYMPPYPEITPPSVCPAAGIEAGQSSLSISLCLPTDDFRCTTLAHLPSIGLLPSLSSPKVVPPTTYTFVTTAKNPSVVYSPISTPRYGHGAETKAPQDKHTAAGKSTDSPRPPGSNNNSAAPPRESAKEPPKATYTVTVAPTKVIINDQTFTQKGPSETTEVTVDGAHFTINPSEVVGGGTVVDRPGNVGRTVMAPSSTVVGGLPVVVAPGGTQNVVVVAGTTFQLQPTPVTAVVQGQTIVVQPSSIVFQGQTVSISRSSPVQTEIVVAGGEMITAIGPSVVVVRSTTITYGQASSTVTETIDDDTILIGPSGVVVRNMTMGGPNASFSDTTYEIVGGATITQVGASLVVVGGTTFTVGPGRGTTTTVVGGETVTIGPSGVAVSTLSFPYPFGPTVITTINAPTSTTGSAPLPSETKTNGGAGVRTKASRPARLAEGDEFGKWGSAQEAGRADESEGHDTQGRLR
ncbi:hypothetical protein CPLU01_00158 [Colletotrichum plurivorum]|uniref:Uncharacterized protein n=1 Tax=Colletotrichum plurivorum TaxID=2175906 RepID=A0A8H6NT20_9PEZI|nr:hypothetical protein CPLU01_00158 [Colletotrichum plurivorum]